MNYPQCVDEITHMDPDDARTWVMSATQPTNRITLLRDRTAREKPTGYKSALMLSTANSSLHQIINNDARAGVAGSARVLELIFDRNAMSHTKNEADMARAEILANYGWLGQEFMRHVMMNGNTHHLMLSVRTLIAKINKDYQARSSERYPIAAAAASIVALDFANHLGLIAFDAKAVYDWFVTKQLPLMRAKLAMESAAQAGDNVIREFLSSHVLDTIETDATTGNIPLIQLRNQLAVHTRRDLNEHWISKRILTDWCNRRGFNIDAILTELHLTGMVKEVDGRRIMGEGTKFGVSRNAVVIVCADHPDLI